MARRRRKARNPETPWLKYALIAGGCYAAYRLLKSSGMLGGNGDDYAPYIPDPVVIKQVEDIVKRPVFAGTSKLVPILQVKKLYDITKEQYKEAPKMTAQAQAQYDFVQAQMNSAKTKAEQLRNKARTKGLNPLTVRAKNIEAAKKEMVATRLQSELPALQREVEAKRDIEKIPAKELRRLEAELAKMARDLDDTMRAAEVVVGADK
jgi:hypothetical protein